MKPQRESKTQRLEREVEELKKQVQFLKDQRKAFQQAFGEMIGDVFVSRDEMDDALDIHRLRY